jgi:hypothetical protein
MAVVCNINYRGKIGSVMSTMDVTFYQG